MFWKKNLCFKEKEDGFEGRKVERGEEGYHDKLTVHAICHTAVTGDTVSEILDLESSFQTAGKEPTEGSDKRGKCREDEDMELNRSDGN
jgi:hypothetical protein